MPTLQEGLNGILCANIQQTWFPFSILLCKTGSTVVGRSGWGKGTDKIWGQGPFTLIVYLKSELQNICKTTGKKNDMIHHFYVITRENISVDNTIWLKTWGKCPILNNLGGWHMLPSPLCRKRICKPVEGFTRGNSYLGETSHATISPHADRVPLQVKWNRETLL